MLARPTIVCRVLRPIAKPLPARAGDVLVCWPDHPTHAVAVLDEACDLIRCHAPYDSGALYGDLLHHFLDARIQMPEQAQRALLSQSA